KEQKATEQKHEGDRRGRAEAEEQHERGVPDDARYRVERAEQRGVDAAERRPKTEDHAHGEAHADRQRVRHEDLAEREPDVLGQEGKGPEQEEPGERRQHARGEGRGTPSTPLTGPGRAVSATTRVDRKSASWRLWVTKTTVLRARVQMDRSHSPIKSRVCSSSAPNGSSMSTISESIASARA